jgi:hypothetical protein
VSYRVESTPIAEQQILTLPHAGQAAYADLADRIAEDPWEGVPWIDQTASAMRHAVFGDQGEGLAVYVILDRDERVVVVKVLWAG